MTTVNGAGGVERETKKRSCNQLKERHQIDPLVDYKLLCMENRL